jgi:hypothetical protein
MLPQRRKVAGRKRRAAERARPPVRVPELNLVIVQCRDDADQAALYRRLKAEGYRCRLQTM